MSGGTAAWLVVAGFVIFLLAGAFGCWVGYGLGLDHAARDEADQLEAQIEGRHRQRPPEPAPPPELGWTFFGGAQVEPQPGAAEYQLMTQTAESGLHWCSTCGHRHYGQGPMNCPPEPPTEQEEPPAADDETPSAFTCRQAAQVEAWVREWEAQGNYDRHLIYARDRT